MTISSDLRSGERIAVDGLRSSAARAGYAYWDELRKPRMMPSRSDVSPRALAGLLRHVTLVAAIPDRGDYLFSLVGDEAAAIYSPALRHRHLSEVDAEIGGMSSAVKAVFDEVCRKRSPLAFCSWITTPATKERYRCRETVVLPLGKTDDRVDHLFIVDAPLADPAQSAVSKR